MNRVYNYGVVWGNLLFSAQFEVQLGIYQNRVGVYIASEHRNDQVEQFSACIT